MFRRVFLASLLACAGLVRAAVPTPKEHFGFTPGDDYKLADYGQISAYYKKLAAASNRMRLMEFGTTSEGRPMLLAVFSSPENIQNLDKYRDINRRLALGQATQDEAHKLAQEGKAIVWIDSGLHASEVAPTQHSPELAYRMVTAEDAESRRIREKVILLQVPCINPDGLDLVVNWYRKNIGTPYELAPLPWLYQKYAGHDNNRDYYMLNLPETRNVSRMLFREWFPQIVYNQHQAPAFPARIFVPPYAEPLNPNIPAPVMEGINLIGAAMKERFSRESKPGILSYYGFDAWWNGGLRSVPAFHNMHGILTETALYGYGTPGNYTEKDLPERFPNGIPTKEPTVFYERPWLGGKWGTRNAIEYMLTADLAILDLASTRSEAFLFKAWELASTAIEAGKKGKPFAYVVPQDQWDPSSAEEMLRRLQMSGIEVRRAKTQFSLNGKTYASGTFVVPVAQAFRSYLVDLLEPQKYPDLRTGASGTIRRPYDVAGWTLSMQMNAQVDRVEDPFDADLEPLNEIPRRDPARDHNQNSSFLATADLLKRDLPVRWAKDGRVLTKGEGGFDGAAFELKKPRVAVYEPWVANMDTGWTRFVLDSFQVPHAVLHNADIQKGNLRSRFDVIVLASQTTQSILHGHRDGERPGGRTGRGEEVALQRPEFTGGIEIAGVAALQSFVREGGTLITFDAANDLAVQFFPIPVRSVAAGGEEGGAYYSPGSILRISVDTTNPIALGMPAEAFAFTSGGQAYDVTLLPDYNKGERQVRSVATYARKNLLASGWITGERQVQGRSILIDANYGKGKVVLFGFRPQFRGQTHGTFKLLLNAIYLSAAKKLL